MGAGQAKCGRVEGLFAKFSNWPVDGASLTEPSTDHI